MADAVLPRPEALFPTPASPLPSVSVVLVSWNRKADLEVALRSVRRQEYAGAVEVIVVDNGSTDGSLEWLASGGGGALVLYPAGRNLGASAARNLGMRLASGELIAFFDSDAELLDPRTLAVLAGRLGADPKLGGVAPAISLDREGREIWLLGGYLLPCGYCDMRRMVSEWEKPDFLSTCASLWRREALIGAGGFDPDFPYGYEDCELSLRVTDAGWDLAVEPSLRVQHHVSRAGRSRFWESWQHYVHAERNRNRLQLGRLGVRGWLRELAWLWTREGRWFRGTVYTGSGMGRWRIGWLLSWLPLRTLPAWPSIRRARGRNWVQEARVDEGRIERIGN